MPKRFLTVLVGLAILVLLVQNQGGRPADFDFEIYRATAGYTFSLEGWMAHNLPAKLSPARVVASLSVPSLSDSDLVRRYFSVADRANQLENQANQVYSRDKKTTPQLEAIQIDLESAIGQRDSMETQVEDILSKQFSEVLRQENLDFDVGPWRVLFPPVQFKLDVVPNLLVISPRDKIEIKTTVALRSELTLQETEAIEQRADQLGVSALIVSLGGIGTYPTMIPAGSSLDFVLHVVPHEWTHNYLSLQPLGVDYAFGSESNYEVVTINETTANIVGREIGDEVLRRFYPPPQPATPQAPAPQDEPQKPRVDFNKEMRRTRLTVDSLLKQGKVSEAESFMEQERQFLVKNGYSLRKLNQAYFAFYGSYADSPSSVSPIGKDLETLRKKSASLKDFLDTVSKMTSYQDLQRRLK